MAKDSVPEDAAELEVRANWVKCLGEAQTRRRDEAHPPPFLTAPEVRSVAEHIGVQVARRYGVESPQVIAAVATLITMSHPTVLAILLAGHLTVGETAQGPR